MAVAEVLVFLFAGGVGLGIIVGMSVFLTGADDGGALHEMKRDVALEVDGDREVIAGGKEDGAAAFRGGGVDRLVDRGRVDRLTVAGGAEIADAENRRVRERWQQEENEENCNPP